MNRRTELEIPSPHAENAQMRPPLFGLTENRNSAKANAKPF
jgi:hypothetical protein